MYRCSMLAVCMCMLVYTHQCFVLCQLPIVGVRHLLGKKTAVAIAGVEGGKEEEEGEGIYDISKARTDMDPTFN